MAEPKPEPVSQGMPEQGADRAPETPSAGETLDREAEEARLLLQRRLSSFGKYSFLVQLFFFLLWVFVMVMSTTGHWKDQLNVPAIASAIPAPLLGAMTWLLAGWGRPKVGVLWTIDGVCVVLTGASYALVGYHRWNLETAFTPVAYLLLLRAVFLPSVAWRTLAVTCFAFVPSLAVVPVLMRREVEPGGSVPESWLFFTARLAFWIVIPSVVSRVLYGLRTEVRDARKLGPYTLAGKIGEGGMGTVYRARHALLRRETAIKILNPEAVDETTLARFEREVQATSQLTHPNTVSVFDYGRTSDGRFYYVMEYLRGMDLAVLVERHGPQQAARVIHILSQACGALQEAHSRGLLHRDIKPENVILGERGGIFDFVKVVDFGLVKKFRGRPEASLTAPDIVVGTLHYIPPEALASPETRDARSDVYSVGAVGYFLLTGKPPFKGEDIFEVSMAQITADLERPSVSLGRPVPGDLELLILSCLERDMDRRPKSAHALQEALTRCADAGKWTQEVARAWWKGRAIS